MLIRALAETNARPIYDDKFAAAAPGCYNRTNICNAILSTHRSDLMRTNVSLISALALMLCTWLSIAPCSQAAVTGAVVPIPPPPSLLPEALESDSEIFFIEEQTDYVLPADVLVDSDGTPGLYYQPLGGLPAILPAGSLVNIHLLHFDPVGRPFTPVRVMGSVSFSHPVVGLAFRANTLNASDVHGAPGTVYPIGTNRNFEFGALGMGVNDAVEVSPDRMTLTLDWGATEFIDQLRVFTAVPEPSGALIVSAILVGHGLCLRRKQIAISPGSQR